MTGGADVSLLPDNVLVLVIMLVEVTDSLSVTILLADTSSILVAGLVDVAEAIELPDKALIKDNVEAKLLIDVTNGTDNFSLLNKFAVVEETDGILTSLLLDAVLVTVVDAAEVNIDVMMDSTEVLAIIRRVVAAPSELYEPITDSVDVLIEVSKVAVVYKLDALFTVELMAMSIDSNSVVESTGVVDTTNAVTAVVGMTKDRVELVF